MKTKTISQSVPPAQRKGDSSATNPHFVADKRVMSHEDFTQELMTALQKEAERRAKLTSEGQE